MSYIVWQDGPEGWWRSDELDTMTDCFEYIRTQTYGRPYLITKPVLHELREVNP